MPGRDRDSEELRAVAPLVAGGPEREILIGPITLVENNGKTLGVTSAELLRPYQHKKLRVLTKLDGSAWVDVTGIGMGRYAGIGLIDLAKAVPPDSDVSPLSIDHVCATNDTRGAPSGLVSIIPNKTGYERLLIPVYVDNDDGGGMSDTIQRLATPMEAAHQGLQIEGAPLFTWFPPNPVLGRANETLAVAIAYPYRARTAKPRALRVLAELIGLDDLGRALISKDHHATQPELSVVTGAIELDDELDE